MMRKIILSAVLLTGLAAQAFAEVNVSADVVSRYLWRGQQMAGGMAVQPDINYTTGSVTIGTWVSQPMMDGMTETNLYVSLDAGPLGITITDYTDAHNDLFSVGDHLIEVMATYSSGALSAGVAIHALNGNEDLWVELGYDMGQMGDADVSLSLGLGNESYSSNGDPKLALFGINASQGNYFASYQINVDRKANMAMIGKTF